MYLKHPRTNEEHIVSYCLEHWEVLPPSIYTINDSKTAHKNAIADLKAHVGAIGITKASPFAMYIFENALEQNVDWVKVTRKIYKKLMKREKAIGTLWER